jgi:arsenate reductase
VAGNFPPTKFNGSHAYTKFFDVILQTLMDSSQRSALLPALKDTAEKLTRDFKKIPDERKHLLATLSNFISERLHRGEKIQLNFICTHNSRRSHIAQLWAQAAAHHYDIPNVYAFSGGTEATAFNPRAVKAMQDAGFEIRETSGGGSNPVYEVIFAHEAPPLKAFSKAYDDPFNPRENFAAIMTCSHADENCPLVSGATKRFAVTYDDPKDFDNTEEEKTKYSERVMQIGSEILYTFSLVEGK